MTEHLALAWLMHSCTDDSLAVYLLDGEYRYVIAGIANERTIAPIHCYSRET